MRLTFDDLDKDSLGQFITWKQDRSCYDWAKSIIENICDRVSIEWHGPRGAECFLVGYKDGKRRSFALQVWDASSICVLKSYDSPEKREKIRRFFKGAIT